MRTSNDSTLFQKAIVESNKFGMCITRATWPYETAFWRCNKQHRSYFVPFLQSFVHNWPFVFMPFSLYLLLWASRHDYFAIVLVSVVTGYCTCICIILEKERGRETVSKLFRCAIEDSIFLCAEYQTNCENLKSE